MNMKQFSLILIICFIALVSSASAASPCYKKLYEANFFKKATVQDVAKCVRDLKDIVGVTDLVELMNYKQVLHKAARKTPYPEVLEFLVMEAGMDPNSRHHMVTPLHSVFRGTDWPTSTVIAKARALIKMGGDVNARTNQGNTPLHWADHYAKTRKLNHDNETESFKIVNVMVNAGAQINAANNSGNTPLHYAVQDSVPLYLKALLRNGADHVAVNKREEAPRDNAGKRSRKILDEEWFKISPPVRKKMLALHERRVAAIRNSKGKGIDWFNLGMAAVGSAAIAIEGEGSVESIDAASIYTEKIMKGEANQTFSESMTQSLNNTQAGVGGPCGIPDYPRATDISRLGLTWCSANVPIQVRSHALIAAGAQCAISKGTANTLDQITAKKLEIENNCAKLAALGNSRCQCPQSLLLH